MSIAKYKRILITGGAGFVGSNLAVMLKKDLPKAEIICLDNLKRRGSELAVRRLKASDVDFVHGDIRCREDLQLPRIDLLIECAAEPSVMAGIDSSPNYLINTNLVGTLNCLELARKDDADVVFLSTSRVYPITHINNLTFKETDTRFELLDKQTLPGASKHGIAEHFPLDKPRSLYGATKLISEIMISEYMDTYRLRAIINRCGVITGPWQMGKVDQGVFVLWVAKHYFKKELSYIGYGGSGKQVRDFIHIADLYRAVKHQLDSFSKYSGEVYNVGGGLENSVSLQELTRLCEEITGNKITIKPIIDERPADLISFITDSRKFKEMSGLTWQKGPRETVQDIYNWIKENEDDLRPILS
ncbi:MAG TPA: NAD-dependent epimerase/dehydratase family protein [Candidatus Saccharimonadales bacterium]|nr:NAD-dependent epimerase/dehydratase family protein [Candidatus Saccharimonadales bacterium]